jgi:hypothetical protein
MIDRISRPARPTSLAPIVFLLSFGVSCENRSTVSRFDACRTLASKMAAAGHSRADVDCDLSKTVWLVAIPDGGLSVDMFKTAGLPESAALSLSMDKNAGRRWCAVEEVAAAAPVAGEGPTERRRQFDISCVTARAALDKLTVVHGSRVLVTVDGGQGIEVPPIRVEAR